ncbi:MAG: anthranilate synthase component I [Omnitrophica bacterium GWA2_52_8]|nr:MAG: anthranilate synthase component I [Omnitrophica bacterium GWA2_52_8]
MITPDVKTFLKLCRKGNLVALIHGIPADLETPVSCFLKLAANKPQAFLLESAEQGEQIGRYSFMGCAPKLIIEARGNSIKIQRRGIKKTENVRYPILDFLSNLLSRYKLANPDALPDFCGGLVGYLGYEYVQQCENITLHSAKATQVPDAVFFLVDNLIIFDHFRKQMLFVRIAEIPKASSKQKLIALYQKELRDLRLRVNELSAAKVIPRASAAGSVTVLKLKSNTSPAAFYKRVKKVKQYIRAGDCIQVVLSQRFKLSHAAHDFQIYRALRSINPSPYMFYFRHNPYRLIGSSPEMLVKKAGSIAEVRPIAGTRPRGKTLNEDQRYEEQLRKSPKEMAEHLMLVDLGRNDLGRVCQFNSIKIKDFARVERYSHVMHLVSDVMGKLRRGQNAFSLLKAAFPAGTVSGAPKIRAMQIIDELEKEQRGPYAGCLGYFSFTQNMDMCITIRTLVLDGKNIYLQAGAGIVQDSHPKREYMETLNKAKALLGAIQNRGQF